MNLIAPNETRPELIGLDTDCLKDEIENAWFVQPGDCYCSGYRYNPVMVVWVSRITVNVVNCVDVSLKDRTCRPDTVVSRSFNIFLDRMKLVHVDKFRTLEALFLAFELYASRYRKGFNLFGDYLADMHLTSRYRTFEQYMTFER